jgi:hypothetical protein
VLEKRFWYRRARDNWSGLVSTPVAIKWKKDRDLTGGLLDMVCAAWDAEDGSPDGKTRRRKELSAEQKTLRKKIESTGMGGLSFFAWFGFIGRRVSAQESAEATAVEKERRRRRRDGKTSSPPESETGPEADADTDAEEEDDDMEMGLEIFPDGDDLAVAITEDLWPGAIKYFSMFCFSSLPFFSPATHLLTSLFPAQAQEQDALSDADFESNDEEEAGDLDDAAENSRSETGGYDEGVRPSKKRRSE